jgi:hypothetical protein
MSLRIQKNPNVISCTLPSNRLIFNSQNATRLILILVIWPQSQFMSSNYKFPRLLSKQDLFPFTMPSCTQLSFKLRFYYRASCPVLAPLSFCLVSDIPQAGHSHSFQPRKWPPPTPTSTSAPSACSLSVCLTLSTSLPAPTSSKSEQTRYTSPHPGPLSTTSSAAQAHILRSALDSSLHHRNHARWAGS